MIEILNKQCKPVKGSKYATCYDLFANEEKVIHPGKVEIVKLGFKTDFAWKLYARSSLPLVKGLIVANGVGVIDADYRGEAGVVLLNIINEPVLVKEGEKLCQMEADELDMTEGKLNETKRGEGGYGSTGGYKAS